MDISVRVRKKLAEEGCLLEKISKDTGIDMSKLEERGRKLSGEELLVL